jgi:hypothetical protein
VALVRTDVSEEPGASFIRVTRIGELGTTQAATSNRRTLRSLSPPRKPQILQGNFFSEILNVIYRGSSKLIIIDLLKWAVQNGGQ